jgi:uncharacterized protein YndB with AHSA1/START domain
MNAETRTATRARIIDAEVLKLEQRQGRERAARDEARANRPTAQAQVFVDPWPEQTFRMFVEEAGVGLRTKNWSWIQPESGRYMRFGQRARGRVVEAYDASGDEGFEVGRVTAWRPGARLAFTWRAPDWPEGVSTDVDVLFESLFGGTLLSVEHSGFERLGPKARQAAADCQLAWTHAIGWVAARARQRGAEGNGP